MIKKVFPDKEKVKSMLKLIEEREKFLQKSDIKFPTIIAETYYEIIKELILALLLTRGLKPIGENAHREMIENLSKFKFLEHEIFSLQDLRQRRNKSMYEGKQIDGTYIENNKADLILIIKKLKEEIKSL